MHKKKINLADCLFQKWASLPSTGVSVGVQAAPAGISSAMTFPHVCSVCSVSPARMLCAEILNQNHQLLEKQFSPPWSIFKMVLCFWKIFFLTLKRKGSWCLSILGKFYQRLTLSVRTSGFKRQNQKTETPKSRKLRFSNGNMASRVEKETER